MSTFPEVKSRLLEAEFTATYQDGTTALIPVVVKALETRVSGNTVEVLRARRGDVAPTGPGRWGGHIAPALYPQQEWFQARWHVVHPVTGAEGFFETDHFLREPAVDESSVTGLTVQRTVSEVGSIQEDRHLTAIEIIRREALLLKRFNGSYVAFFIRNDSGERCPDCFDHVLQRRTRSQCRTCNGTGFRVGYSKPILGYCYHKLPAQQVGLQQLGEIKREEGVEWWMPAVPRMKPGDFFVKRDGSRWRIDSGLDRTKLEGEEGAHEVRQFGPVRRIDPSDIEMTIPAPSLERPPDVFVGFMTGSTEIDPATGILIEASGAR